MKQFRGTALLIFLVLQAAGAGAQDFRAAYPGTGSVTMSGEWRFHTSDDLKWANPSLDDTGWETITADGTWGSQTHPGHVGFAWYRRAVQIDGVAGPLSIAMPGVNDAYELYWNGVKFAGQGKLPPNATWRPVSVTEVFPLPVPEPPGC